MHDSDLRSRLESSVAVIGLAGRFPGAAGVRAFWENLQNGVESITNFTDEELREAGVDPSLLAKPGYVKACAVLDGIELFDAPFFGFTPREAEITDPQQRLFLECAWEALEDAGYDASAYRGLIGVYAGVGVNTYLFNLYSNPAAMEAVGRFRTIHGNDKDYLAAWTAYKLDLRGPAVCVQTACSTSLVAIHLACQALLNGECDMALAGGVSFSAHQKAGYLYQEGGIHSPDGHCRPFDARAAGTVGGNGLGIVVLKRLKEALADGDHVHAAVRGTAINNDGAGKVGFTAPSVEGQAAVISEALALAEVDPASVSYVETHGTGTSLGDPIEIAALTEAFRSTDGGCGGGRCGIGSVKSNIGHLDTASGVTGFIKTVLALERRLLPPTLHFERPNPNVDFAGSPFFVVNELREWRPDGSPRRAGVSSFGIGGTNAHAVLEEAPAPPPPGHARPWHLLALSARTASALEAATSNLSRFLEERPEIDLADVAYTLQVGRKAFQHRRIAVCRDARDAARTLAETGSRRVLTRAEEPRHRPVAFLFPGQGAQHPGMALGLYREEPSFRDAVDRCCETLRAPLGFDLREVLLAPPEAGSAGLLRETRLAQPALFVVEYALAQLWMEWGIRPEALLGHSVGEYVAACLAGVFGLDDALALVAERGRLIQELPAGAMLAVALPEAEVLPMLGDGLSLAAVNGPAACVVSGAPEAVTGLARSLAEAGIEHQSLHTSHAFHSSLMEPALERFTAAVRRISLSPPRIPFVSNLTGTWITAEEATDPGYWARHLRQTVRFSAGLATLAEEPGRIFLEVGPGDSLSRLARRQEGLLAVPSMRHPREEAEDLPVLLQALGNLWTAGVAVAWDRLHAGQGRRRLPLPTYPFERQRYWVDLKPSGGRPARRALEKRPDVADWLYLPVWRQAPPPSGKAAGESWLLFSEPGGPAVAVAERLRQRGGRVTEVLAGNGFSAGEERIAIDPRHPGDYAALFAELRRRGPLPDRIVHLWNLGPARRATLEDLEGAEARAFYSLLFLAQALPRTEGGRTRLDVVSSGLQRVVGDEEIEPAKALLLGPVRVLPRERPDIVCRSLDLPAGDGRSLDPLVDELLAAGPEPLVALRGGRRWVQAFETVRPAGSGWRLRDEGVYLITGGLGGIGLTLAGELARRVRARLVLVSRSGPATERALQAVRSLEEMGAEVLALAADVADPGSMADCLRRAEERFGPVTGVVHAAGVPGGGLIELKEEAGAAAVMAPKVRGTLVLDALLGPRPLDFFVLCSSLTAVTGGIGEVDYCAANAFLDAFAQSRASYGSTPVVSLAWSAWAEVGMAARTELPFESPERRRQRTARAILPAEGIDALEGALSLGASQVVVSPQDLETVIELSETTDDLAQRLEKGAAAASAATHQRPDLPQAYVAPRGELEREIASIWQEVLGLERVGVHDGFAELGGDSLMGIRVLSRLRERLEAEIPLRLLFEHPTPAGLAAAVEALRLASRSLEADGGELTPPPLVRVARDAAGLPLSYGQQRLWFLDRLQPGNPAYHLVNFFRLEGRLHVPALAMSLREIVRRHEVLRTAFRTVDGEPRQVVLAAAEVPFPIVDLSALPLDLHQGEARRLAAQEVRRPFDLESGSPLRTVLLRLEEEVHHLLVAVHHIASDGWSSGVLAQETVALYSAFRQGEPSPLPELPIQYADFSVWQLSWLQGSVLDRQLAYWRRQLAGVPAALDLPADRPRPAVQSSRGDTRTFAWPPALAADLQQLGREQGATIFMVLLALFQTFLHRYTHAEDLSVGCPVANRNRQEIEDLIGFFVNTLVLRTDLSGAPSFRDLLGRARETVLQAQAHQDVPFEKLVEELLPERNLARSPLFQVMLVLQTPTRTVFELPGVRLLGLPAEMTAAQFDLTLFVQESAGSLRGTAQYSTDLFEAVTVDRFLGSLTRIAEAVAADPTLRLPEIPLLSPSERHQMTVEWNDVATGVATTPMARSFELQAAHRPQSVAVIDDDGILTYRDLNRQANRLARHLAAQGVGGDRVVALLADRGRAFLVAILAVFKAGGAYLPLDLHHPPSRWRQILTGSGARWVLAGAGHAPLLAAALAELPEDQRPALLPFELTDVDDGDDVNPPLRTWPESLAYVIYTSGSTGTPKGAMVEHRGMLNHLRAKVAELGLNDRDLIAQTASQCFDISVWEFLAALLVGGRVRVFPDETARDPERLLAAVDREGVTILETVPSLLRVMLDGIERREDGRPALRALRWLSPTGEALPPALCRRWLALYPRVPLLNAYGPTECSDNVAHWAVSHPPGGAEAAVPIGRTMDNFRLYVLDASLALVPVGVPGELFVAGIGVGRGYLKDSAKTAAVFIPDPFAAEPGGRLYRTGDRVAWQADGTLQFLGRLDHQVKVRGFRIELGEVEAALSRLAGVHEAVVTAYEVAGEKRLVGYVVPAGAADLSANDLRAGLREVLPEYEIPAHFVFLDALPLNSSGKIDRRALPAPNLSEALSHSGHEALRTPAEELLAALWADLLKVERVGAGDGFFELGGHSLLAARLVSRVRAAFGVEMPLRWVFETPALAALAARIQEARSAQAGLAVPSIRRIPRTGREVLSFAQERLWFLDQLEPGLPVYNIDSALRLRGTLDLAALERSVDELVRRHEALRTVFESEQGRPYQRILPELGLPLSLVDLATLPEAARETAASRLAAHEAARPFALDRAPLLRLLLIRLGPADHVIVLTLHHIVGDGWSMDVLVRELVDLYQAFARNQPSPLPELPVQYADFAAWQKEWLRGPVLEAHLAYWREQLAGASHVLELPADRPRPVALSFRGASRRFVLPARLAAALSELGREQGTTLFMTLLSALYVLLFRSTGQEDLLVGTPIANRGRAELESLIGFFANTLVLRGRLAGRDRFLDLLARVREAALGAYTYQDFPFEKIVAEVQPERDLASSPLFQVLFVLQNTGTGGVELADLSLAPFLGGEHVPAKLDLALAVTEMADGRLAARFDYSTDLFDPPTVGRMAEHWVNLLEAASAVPESPLADLPALSQAEIWQVGGEWSAASYPGGSDGDVVSLIEAQAARDPGATALVCGGERLTYGALVARTERLARGLRALGVGPETRVGLCVERSPEMIVGLLGVLKAGGAYVPLDPAYPAERLAILLEDSGIELLLTQPSLLRALPEAGRPVRRVCFGPELEDGATGILPPRGNDPAQAAYVIYTSGSTGRPKGVVAHHGGLARYTSALAWAAGLGPGDRVLQFLSISFDAAAEQIYPTLASGASLVLHPAPGRLSPAELLAFCAEQGVTVVEVPMELMRQLFRELERGSSPRPPVRAWLTGGESLGSDLVEQWRSVAQEDSLFLSCYGPTEATVTATVFPLRAGRPGSFPPAGGPIGRPLGGAEAFILDAALRPVPAGVAGELYLGGSGVTRGYLDRPDLTASAFIPHPLSGFGGRGPGQRLYRTGDLARWRPDGNLEFLRRADQQVKLRSHRIELGEIESHLARHPAVVQAVVDVREMKPGDRRLIAWIVPAGAPPAEPSLEADLRGFLRESLPEYMVPSHFTPLDRLPLTPSGKVDRRALPKPKSAEPGQDSASPSLHGEVEGTLAAIWSQLLGVESIGRDDDFFDRGGHSLLAIQMVSRLREAFGMDLPLRLVFEHSRLQDLSAALERRQRGEEPGTVERIQRRPAGTAAPLSDAQQRLWFLHQLEPGSGAYNLPLALRLSGRLEVAALRWSLGQVAARHEVLRSRFEVRDGEAVQVPLPAGEWPLPVADLSALAAETREGEVRRLAAEVGHQPFVLEEGPLVRTCLLRESGDSHVLLMTLHHIAADGWSLGILVREAAALYRARQEARPSPLPELEIQYGDFAAWQRERMQGEALRGQLAYWRAQLAALPPLVEMPSDRPRPAVPTHRGGHRSFRLSPEETAALRRLGRDEGVTFFMLLLAALSLLIHRYTGEDDVVVGADMAGRSQGQTEGLIGFFINMLVMRTDLSGDPTFRELLRRCREVVLGAFAHQDVPYDRLVRELRPERGGQAPLFQVVLNFNNAPQHRVEATPLESLGLSLSEVPPEEELVRFDLMLIVLEDGAGLSGSWVYSTDLFEPSRIETLHGRFEALLRRVLERPDARLSSLFMEDEAAARRRERDASKLQEFLKTKPTAARV